MDIARPDIKLKKKRQMFVWAGVGVVVLAAAAFGVSRLKPAAPTVDRLNRLAGHGQTRQHDSPGARLDRDPATPRGLDTTDPGPDRRHRGSHPRAARHNGQARHDPDGPGGARGGAEAARREAASQAGRVRLQEPAGLSAKHPDGQEDPGGAGGCQLFPGQVAGRYRSNSFSSWARFRAWSPRSQRAPRTSSPRKTS